jgi:Fic family protein
VLGEAKPRDRSEREIFGYRHALNLIHTNAESLSIDPSVLRQLHRTIQEDTGDAGRWKNVENEIIELKAGEAPRVRFRPVTAAATPAAVDELCLLYRDAVNQRRAPPLVTVAALVLDFLCVHPFRDGNGRVSRLLTLLALYQHGYEVGRYISLERLVEETREEYYEALRKSSEGWHSGAHDLLPWLLYFLSVVRRAYRELGRVLAAPVAKDVKTSKRVQKRV